MRRLKLLLLFVMIAPADAAAMACSVHARPDIREPALTRLARISQDQALKVALASLKATPSYTVEGALKVEDGCLIYSFAITLPGEHGVEAIMVDAGSGMLLAHNYANPQQEAAERGDVVAAGPRRP